MRFRVEQGKRPILGPFQPKHFGANHGVERHPHETMRNQTYAQPRHSYFGSTPAFATKAKNSIIIYKGISFVWGISGKPISMKWWPVAYLTPRVPPLSSHCWTFFQTSVPKPLRSQTLRASLKDFEVSVLLLFAAKRKLYHMSYHLHVKLHQQST